MEQDTVTISMYQYNDLLKTKESMEKIFNVEKGVISISWYHGWAKYYSPKEFNDHIIENAKKEVDKYKCYKRVLDKLSKMSIWNFLKYKRSYSYTSYCVKCPQKSIE